MTTIVAIVKDGRSLMAADSCVSGSAGKRTIHRDMGKIVHVGNMLIGMAGWVRDNNILRHEFKPLKEEFSNPDDYIYAVTESLRDMYEARRRTNMEPFQYVGSDFVILYKNNIYEILGDFCISKSTEPFVAIGSGTSYATGYLEALYKSPLDVKELSIGALECAAKYATGTEGPWILKEMIDD